MLFIALDWKEHRPNKLLRSKTSFFCSLRACPYGQLITLIINRGLEKQAKQAPGISTKYVFLSAWNYVAFAYALFIDS